MRQNKKVNEKIGQSLSVKKTSVIKPGPEGPVENLCRIMSTMQNVARALEEVLPILWSQ